MQRAGSNPCYVPGDFMLIHDHINFLGTNPLIGCGRRRGRALSRYDGGLRQGLTPKNPRVGARARSSGCRKAFISRPLGPSFETPAEIRAFRDFRGRCGRHVDGARGDRCTPIGDSSGRTCPVSANAAAGMSSGPLTHLERWLRRRMVCA